MQQEYEHLNGEEKLKAENEFLKNENDAGAGCKIGE